MPLAAKNDSVVWRGTKLIWAVSLAYAALLSFIFYESWQELVRIWNIQEEYSYGYLIPFISLFLIWQRKDELERMPFQGSWYGVLIIFLGLALAVVGNFATLYLVLQYAAVIVLAGVVLSYTGSQGFKIVWVPLLFLLFMIPLPVFFLQEISAKFQLMSSEIGVGLIRLFNISVFLDGNVIDLGTFKLQVVEACSGLRYLFPLMTLAFISAYFFKDKFWKRAVIFLSSIPITILMNSFRIGTIGVMVEYWGRAAAEGFLHDFEGWAVFMVCTAVLIAEMWILARVGSERRSLREVFGLEFPAPTPKDARIQYRDLPKPSIAGLVIMIVAALTFVILPQRVETKPVRMDFSQFPVKVGEWQGHRERIESIYLDEIKLSDYILADYTNSARHQINLYVAYYDSQRKHQSAHSPRTCIPGGGWRIQSITPHAVAGVMVGGAPLMVNRLMIQKGEAKQLVYYWFQQRGRIITNEYMVKWYLFWDALTRNRTDGALVRLTTFLKPNAEVVDADRELDKFAGIAVDELKNYIPD
jgi:exosortase D (VPLPA-CTERM-specific)